ncbi:MAG: chromate transporter [Ruminococcaceae bacterium]|nr:chromate transporter [Oscillospiraceae bacterium]
MEQKKDQKLNILTKLFFTMLYISSFTFGGGFVIVTLMKKKFVDEMQLLDEQEMLDITSIAQSTPGAIAVNAAVIVGKKLAGSSGIAAAVLGTVLPPIVIISVISLFYNAFSENFYVSLILRGMQAGIAAVILDVVCSLSEKSFRNKKLLDILLIITAFVLVFFFKVNVIIIILSAAVIGAASLLINKRRAEKK